MPIFVKVPRIVSLALVQGRGIVGPMTLRLSEQDRERIRYHLGYLNTDPVSSIQLGFPASGQHGFLVERAMEYIRGEAVSRVLRVVSELDSIECQMAESRQRLKAQQLGEIKIRNTNEEQTEGDLLEREYVRWARRLADQLGVVPNPLSSRFNSGGVPINVRVLLG